MRSMWDESKGLTTQVFALFAETWAREFKDMFYPPSLICAFEIAVASSLPKRMVNSCSLKAATTFE